MTKKKWIIITVLCSVVLIGGAMAGPIMSDLERPKYNVISLAENIEIRLYNPKLIAEVEVRGKRKDAIGDGFRLLADYIFGNNTAQIDIAMTAPVQQQASEKIAMTAPVQQQASGDAWSVSFVMPAEYTKETLAKPNDQRVLIKEVPAQKYIAIHFSGTNSNENIAEHESKLMRYIKANQIQVRGSPIYAFYNPPWTLPFLRRNEVMIEINE